MDSSAIRAGAGNGQAFKYTTYQGISQDDDALEMLFNFVPTRPLNQTERASLISIIDTELNEIYATSPNGIVPDRMKELRILIYEFDYKVTFNSSGMYVFSPK